MALARMINVVLRIAQFICAVIVLGLTSYLLHQRTKYFVGPFARLTYSVVIAAVSIVLTFVWALLPLNLITAAIDFLFVVAWFAVFGVLQDWYADSLFCGADDFYSGGVVYWGGICSQWNATQAFSFIAGMLFFASFVLNIIKRHDGDATASPVSNGAGAQKKRFWNRSKV